MRNINKALLTEIGGAIRAGRKDKPWPDHIVAQAARVQEPVGALVSTSLLVKYHNPSSTDARSFLNGLMRSQAIETAAAAIRFIENMDNELANEQASQLSTKNLLEENHETTELHSA